MTTSSYFLKLDTFEGPLDLLLHLIRAHELDIFDIDLFVLTKQYVEYLRLVEFKDLTSAADFMEMAASLCQIKSQGLLPSTQTDTLAEDGKDEEMTAEILQKRLLEYETFRQASEFLSQRLNFSSICKTNQEWQRLEPLYAHVESPLRGDRATLVVLYEQMLRKLVDRKPVRVQAVKDTISVDTVITKIKEYVEKLQFVLFQQLYPTFSTRYELIANVLAMLQLVRDREMKIHQEKFMGPIWMYPIALDDQQAVQHLAETQM